MDTDKTIVALLRESNPGRNIRWPSGIGLQAAVGKYVLRLSEDATCANMQTNASAFDGWALALKAWLDTNDSKSVEISWKEPSSQRLKDCERHYQRFLYRVIRFRKAMPWLRVANDSEPFLKASKVLLPNGQKKPGVFRINHSLRERKDEVSPLPSDKKTWTENMIEIRLAARHESFSVIGWKGRIDRQLPVGIFEGEVREGQYVFTGKKSAVDLWMLDSQNNRMALFELKRPGNHCVGAISELIFYAFVIRDVFDGVFLCENSDLKAQGVGAFLLVYMGGAVCDVHPLLDNEQLFHILNEAFSQSDVRFGLVAYDRDLHLKEIY